MYSAILRVTAQVTFLVVPPVGAKRLFVMYTLLLGMRLDEIQTLDHTTK